MTETRVTADDIRKALDADATRDWLTDDKIMNLVESLLHESGMPSTQVPDSDADVRCFNLHANLKLTLVEYLGGPRGECEWSLAAADKFGRWMHATQHDGPWHTAAKLRLAELAEHSDPMFNAEQINLLSRHWTPSAS